MTTRAAVAQRAAETAARSAFGRLLSWLAWQWRDIAAAEDALSDALVKALERWPLDGVPDKPEAWLLAVARRQLLQVARHDRVRCDPAVTMLLADEDSEEPSDAFPDARLKLLFVCAHPAIDERVRIPLMLQTVLGLQVADMAPALLMSPAALAQRLVRAKQKIRDTGLRFEEPAVDDLPQRLHHVLEAIYGAFGLGLDAVDGAEERITSLGPEAKFLCKLVCVLLPNAAEPRGLLAMMTLIDARAAAREPQPGQFVPLPAQDPQLWDRDAIVVADKLLWEAARLRNPGPFQLEAAIQSAHCHRLFTGSTPWSGIAQLYANSNSFYPTLGSRVAGAVATAEAGELEQGLLALDAIDASEAGQFQPWWVARAYLLDKRGDVAGALDSYERAIGLTSQSRLRAHLQKQMQLTARSVRPT